MRLQFPITNDTRVLIYSRFSTDEQRQQSIEDQQAYCLDFLTSENNANLGCVQFIQDEAMSGELRNRPGIDQVRQQIMLKATDLIVVEDSSRLFRGVGACDNFVSLAVDHDVRVIAINDSIDTLQEDWQQRLTDAQRHHSQDNYYTRFRIKRAHDGLWRIGAAFGPRHPGYCRVIRNPEMKRPPKFDEIDEAWTDTLRELFQRVARGEPLWQVAEFCMRSELPKTSHAQNPTWDEHNVLSVIRNPIYRGVERFRETIAKKHYTTGKSRQIRNPEPSAVLERTMPHLRIVEDWLWHLANQAINDRRRKKIFVRGPEHPLSGVARDSRSPLSNIFICAICGDRMSMEGRNEGGYRCSGTRRQRCWNKVTALRDFTHLQIGTAVSQVILEQMETVSEAMLEYLQTVIQSTGDTQQQERELTRRRGDLERRQQRLLRVLQEQDEPPVFISEQIQVLRHETGALEQEEQELQRLRSQEVPLPSPEEYRNQLNEAAKELSLCRRESAPLLQQLLVGPIKAIPCQQFGSNKIVMRAEFTLELMRFLPENFRLILRNRGPLPEHFQVFQRSLVVDLFEPSMVPKLALSALDYFESFPGRKRPTMQQLAEHFKTDRCTVNRAVRLGRRMRDAGLTDPFVPLTESPANPSRWRNKRAG